ncbi:COX assembly mitochondrial protein homolog [Anneissia japonica]|uniref:COX assembly mitochondrial protein homolog n=1 Tax=Anneissia japonica TaxID=1529436 RepID=UPI0014256B1B|nr:COX assembly mitochondrial protein homolog [Anneissia japonica]
MTSNTDTTINSQKLRKVELEVLIPKKIREKAKILCDKEVADFTKCCKESSLAMVYKCRAENSALKECLTKHIERMFNQTCTQEYLQEREEYRRTGVKQKPKRYPSMS